MKRRSCLVAAGTLSLASRLSWSRPTDRPARIGWLASMLVTRWPPYATFVEAMRERGWVEGTHFSVDAASYDGHAERIPALVAELLARQPDVIIGSATASMRPLMLATKTVPIVMFAVGDPVGQGFVASLARPDGNVTGLSSVDHGLLVKQFELFLQAVPQVRRVGVVFNPDIPPHLPALRDVQTVALRRGVQVRPVAMRAPEELDATFGALQREQVEAVQLFIQPIFNTGDRGARAAALALQQRWPTALGDLPNVRAGILLAYGWKIEDMLRRLPHYVIRILEGARPGDLPVEQPTRFYLSLNVGTARALGLRLPQAVMLQADEVVE